MKRKDARNIARKCYTEAVKEKFPKDQDILEGKKVNGSIMGDIYGVTLYNIIQYLDKANYSFSCSRNEKKLIEGVMSRLSNTRGKIDLSQLKEIVDFITKMLRVIEKEDQQVSIRHTLFGMDCFIISYLFGYVTKKLFPPVLDIFEQKYKEMGYQNKEVIIKELKDEVSTLNEKLRRFESLDRELIEKEEKHQNTI